MTFPKNTAELEAAGFSFDRTGVCKGQECREVIYWWHTPKGKRIPLNADSTPHHATCKNAEQFARKPPLTRGGS